MKPSVPSDVVYEVGAARQQTVGGPRTMYPHTPAAIHPCIYRSPAVLSLPLCAAQYRIEEKRPRATLRDWDRSANC
jgi:hypothetical protein